MMLGIMLGVSALILLRRLRSVHRPMSRHAFRILLPLLFLSPGILLLLNPQAHVEATEAVWAVLLGVVLAVPLIFTTGYETRNGSIYTKPSMGFICFFIGILLLRVLLRSYLSQIEPEKMSVLLFLVASSYIIPWRFISYIKFKRVVSSKDITLSS